MARFILDGVFEGTIKPVGEAAGGACLPIAGGLLVAVFAVGIFVTDSWAYIQHNILNSDQCGGSSSPSDIAPMTSDGIVRIEGCQPLEISGAANLRRRIAIANWSGVFDRQESIEWRDGRADNISIVTGQEIPIRQAGDITTEFFNDGGTDAIFAAIRPPGSADVELTKLFDINVSPDGSKTTIQPALEGFARFRVGRVELKIRDD